MSAPISVGGTVGGKFRVLRTIGEGGMGAVYEVEHLLTRHHRALKLLHGEYSRHPAAVERFLREASAAGRIGSPHIVEALDAGTLDGGEPYLVMELLEGHPLSSLLEKEKQLPVPFAADVVAQAADGMQAAHDAGIIHRDLKTDNLFLVDTPDGRPFVKILDFGICKFDPSHTRDLALTGEGTLLGTPYYMSPEQLLTKPLDGRTDVYSLGVVLYECLTGAKPFPGDTLVEITAAIIQGTFPPMGQLRGQLTGDLEALVGTAMALDREERFATAAELAIAIRRLYPSMPWSRSSAPPRVAQPPSGVPHPVTGGSTVVIASTPADAQAVSTTLDSTTHAGALSRDQTEPMRRPPVGRRLWTVVGVCFALAALGAAGLLLARADPSGAADSEAHKVPSASSVPAAPMPATAPLSPPAPAASAPADRHPPQPSQRPRARPGASNQAALRAPSADAGAETSAPRVDPAPSPPVRPPPERTRAEQAGLKSNPFGQ